GDRVGVFMPLTLECAVATLACARIGAIFTPIFSGYGPGAVATRLVDSGARLLITADGYSRRGRRVEMKEVADAATASAPGRVPAPGVGWCGGGPGGGGAGAAAPGRPGGAVWGQGAVRAQRGSSPGAQRGAGAPYMVISPSGTTGRPRGARHVHAGFPLKAAA